MVIAIGLLSSAVLLWLCLISGGFAGTVSVDRGRERLIRAFTWRRGAQAVHMRPEPAPPAFEDLAIQRRRPGARSPGDGAGRRVSGDR